MASNPSDSTGLDQHLPLLTVGIISCNRFHYLRATLESAHRCIQYPRMQWILVDNASVEPGLRDYLERLDWIDELILRDKRSPQTEHVEAMNEIVARAQGDVVLIWPDDVQFIVEGDWMIDCVEILLAHPWIGSMGLNCLRHVTTQRLWTWRRWLNWKRWVMEAKRRGFALRRQQTVHSSRGFAVRTYGWTKAGIIGSGIPSLTRTEVWRTLGGWRTPGARPGLVDSSGGGETEMLQRYAWSGLVLQRALPILAAAADIVTDPTGTKAKVRGTKRYGVYMPPLRGTLYYRIHKQQDVRLLASWTTPIPFEELVEPLGYSLPLDNAGNLLKSSINESVVSDLA